MEIDILFNPVFYIIYLVICAGICIMVSVRTRRMKPRLRILLMSWLVTIWIFLAYSFYNYLKFCWLLFVFKIFYRTTSWFDIYFVSWFRLFAKTHLKIVKNYLRFFNTLYFILKPDGLLLFAWSKSKTKNQERIRLPPAWPSHGAPIRSGHRAASS